MTAFRQVQIPGFAGGGFVALAGRGYAVAGCAPGIAHPVGQHTFFGAAHIPVGNTNTDRQMNMGNKCLKFCRDAYYSICHSICKYFTSNWQWN